LLELELRESLEMAVDNGEKMARKELGSAKKASYML
jgi:hypothetical protein